MTPEADYDEEWHATLPRSESGLGDNLTIAARHEDGTITITDGTRSARYGVKPLQGDLRIVPNGVEAGAFTEAQIVHISDGYTTRIYEPMPDGDLSRRKQ